MFKKILILIIIFLIYSFYKLPWNYTRYILLCFTIVYFTTKIIFKKWFSLPNLAKCFLIKYEKEDNQSILIDVCKSKDEDNFDSDITPSSFTCLVCGESCDGRHGYENLINLQPFKGLLIDKTINKSLNELFETILELYIFRWTDEIKEFKKDDDKFKNEIRYLLKYLTSTLLKRLINLDLNKIIYFKLIPLLIQHFQTFLNGKRQAKSQQFVEKSVLKSYISNGLICKNIRSKNEEIKWIRNLIEKLLPYLLPPSYLYSTISKSFLREIFTCCLVFPLFELASDPLYVNDILMLIFNDNNEKLEKDKLENMDNNFVEILQNYELKNNDTNDDQSNSKKEDSSKSDLLGIEFHKLLQNQQMLIIFFQYLKDEGSINYLQFILSLESFNEKLFDPEISENEKKELHADALHIYRTYLLSSGCDYLGIQDNQLITEMKDILDRDYEHILELKAFEPLLKAYDEIYSKLERLYYPQFLNSDYYIKMIVGSRLFNFLDECSTEQLIFNEENCEELFENQDEMEDDDDDVYVYDYGAIDLIDIMNADSVSTSEMLEENEKVRDLSQWKVSIDKIDTKIEHNTFKYYYVFQIKIEIDNNNELNNETEDYTSSINQWIVNRKYDEFYVLDGKLRKFHGNALSRIVGLSSKRTLFKQSLAFLDSKKLEFEKYLNELINIPALRRSELIYNFLKPKTDTTTQQEDIFNTKLVDINLKRMIKTVPAKMFSQERGQHLDSFLNSFINSTESQKAKGNVPNLKDIFTEEQSDENCDDNINLDNEFEFNNYRQTANRNLFKANSIYDYLIIVLTRICNLKFTNSLLCKLLIILQPVLNNTIEYIFHLSIKIKINNLLTKDNINKSILLLKDTLLEIDQQNDEQQTLTKLEKLKRQKSQETLYTLQDYFNNFLPNYLSFLNLNNQTGYFLHSIFQYQLLNKQILYLFLNLILDDLFPEIVNFDKKKY